MLERDIEKKLTKWAKKHDVLTYKFNSQAMRGVPDRIYIYEGNVLFLELKQVGKKPTKLQQHHIDKINSHGGVADWAAGFDEGVEKIKEHLIYREI